jgi:hypothetical protein
VEMVVDRGEEPLVGVARVVSHGNVAESRAPAVIASQLVYIAVRESEIVGSVGETVGGDQVAVE